MIARTYIGREFGWDRVEDVNWEALRQERDAAEIILDNPHRYPAADFEALQLKVDEINDFMLCHRADRYAPAEFVAA